MTNAEAIETLRANYPDACFEQLRCAVDMAIKALEKPQRKKGKWIILNKGLKVTSYKCSKCGKTVIDDTGYDVSEDYPFCHCGADMREDGADETR